MKKIILAILAVFMLGACTDAEKPQEEETRIGDRGYNEERFVTGDEEDGAKPILPPEVCDFGNFQWGMALEDVVNVHGGGYKNIDANTIRYERVRIEGFASDAEYVFTEGKLSQATYFITPDNDYSYKTLYIEDYNELADIYTKRYGEVKEQEIEFARGMETDNVDKQGELLGQGNILFRKVWQTNTTELRAVMGKKDEKVVIGVQITPINQ